MYGVENETKYLHVSTNYNGLKGILKQLFNFHFQTEKIVLNGMAVKQKKKNVFNEKALKLKKKILKWQRHRTNTKKNASSKSISIHCN